MKSTILILTILALSGCAGVEETFVRPNTSAEQTIYDWKQCGYEADLATVSISNRTRRVMEIPYLKADCMELKHYTRRSGK